MARGGEGLGHKSTAVPYSGTLVSRRQETSLVETQERGASFQLWGGLSEIRLSGQHRGGIVVREGLWLY